MEFVQSIGTELWVAVALAVAGLSAFDDAVAALVSRIPVVGPILAPVLRRLSVNFRAWMRDKVSASAEKAVKQAENEYPAPEAGPAKKAAAVGTLRATEAGLRADEAEREVQAAYDRMMGGAKLEAAAAAKVAPPAELVTR